MNPMKALAACSVLGAAFVLGAGCAGTEAGSQENDEIAGATVVINEFKGGSSGFVELHNRSAAAVNVSNWTVDDVAGGGTAPKSVGASVTIPAGGFLSVPYSGINVSSADSVRLVDAAGVEVDNHSNFYAGTSTTGKCFGRRPDGGAWAAASIPCTPGASNGGSGLLLRGTVVGPSGPIEGEVFVQGDTIKCVATSCASTPGAAGATVVDTKGIILPGLIDTHNHILFDIFDETHWSPTKSYTNHNQWPSDARYGAMVDAKQYLNGESGSPMDLGCEMDKFGELKGVVAGTTSIVGAANPANQACFGSLARTVDQSPNGLGADKVVVSVLFPTKSRGDTSCASIAAGDTDAYLVHAGEGVDASALGEFAKLGSVTTAKGCLYAPQTSIVHGTAFGDAEMTIMAQHEMSLVWSPRSNVFLYGAGTDLTKTTNIPLARAKGINVALAPDWSIGGSQNLLDELRFAKKVDDGAWGHTLSSKDLFEMVTINPATALGLEGVLGSLEVGKKADLFVITGNRAAPYDALLAATPSTVALTMVGGVPLYGDLPLESLSTGPGCEHIDVCGAHKFVCVATATGTASNKLAQTYAQVQTALETGLADYDDLQLSAWSFSPMTPLVRCP